MEVKMSYEFLNIDKFNLDQECIEQAQKYLEYAEEAVETARVKNEASVRLDELRAQTELRIRSGAAELGTKVTEGIIASRVEVDGDYLTAQLELIQLKANAAKAEAKREAMEQRKNMLEWVCRLYLSEYYSDAVVKGKHGIAENIAVSAIKEQLKKQ